MINRNQVGWLVLCAAIATIAAILVPGCALRPPERIFTPGAPLQIHSPDWRMGAEVELAVQSHSSGAGQTLAVTVLAPGPGQPQIDGVPAAFFGLSGVQVPWLQPEYRPTEMALAAASGARFVGLDFDWRRLEPERGRYAWDEADEVVALAKRHGLGLVPMLLYTPDWASTAPFAPLDAHLAPPVDYGAYRDLVYAVVSRYRPYGALSLTNDGYGIRDWVIWNEPNLRAPGEPLEPGNFWTGSLEEYLRLLQAGYEGAHAADPGCNVLNAGLADLSSAGGNPTGEAPELYLARALERFYDPNGDGNANDGARPYFDTLNLHTYPPGTLDRAWFERRLASVQQVMSRFGDGQKSIWITETGYGSVDSTLRTAAPFAMANSHWVEEEVQALGVELAYQALAASPQVERVFWWSLRNYHSSAGPDNPAMEGHYGLLRADFAPKPAYLAYGRLTGQVGQVLTLTGLTDEQGLARITVPAPFVDRPGRYVVFAELDGAVPNAVAFYQVPASEAAAAVHSSEG